LWKIITSHKGNEVQSISKNLIGNLSHVTIRILSPEILFKCRVYCFNFSSYHSRAFASDIIFRTENSENTWYGFLGKTSCRFIRLRHLCWDLLSVSNNLYFFLKQSLITVFT